MPNGIKQLKHTFGAVAVAASLLPACAYAGTFTALYTFTGRADGGVPPGGLVYVNGALYGTTEIGGYFNSSSCVEGCGTVFKVDLTTGAFTTVHTFTGLPDGAAPLAGLIAQGNLLYGTTFTGGASGCGWGGEIPCGTVFQVNLVTGAERVVYRFSPTGGDGQFPAGSLLNHAGMLYGTTTEGGRHSLGTVFAVDAHTGYENILHSFAGSTDGETPTSGLIYHEGILFGTTEGAPQTTAGTVFAVKPATGAEKVLHDFAGADGNHPAAGLLYDHGALYGTTVGGGSTGDGGVVFAVSAKDYAETVVHNFGAGEKVDGFNPMAGLINVGGLLYGTTFAGGHPKCFNGYTCGTIFSVDPTTGTETVLYQFPGNEGPAQPMAGLIYVNGAFYGTSASENVNACENNLGCGTVFKFVP